ncbi:hypothetical protein Tco_1319157 [Tanacetum coccineum]
MCLCGGFLGPKEDKLDWRGGGGGKGAGGGRGQLKNAVVWDNSEAKSLSSLLQCNVESAESCFHSNATLLPICESSFLDGVIFLFFKLLLGILSMIGSSLGMLLKRKNTSSMLLLLSDFLWCFGEHE